MALRVIPGSSDSVQGVVRRRRHLCRGIRIIRVDGIGVVAVRVDTAELKERKDSKGPDTHDDDGRN